MRSASICARSSPRSPLTTTSEPIEGSREHDHRAGRRPKTAFDFEGSVGTLLLLRDVETQRFTGSGSWNGERWDRLSVHGSFDDATRVAFDYDRGDATGGVSFEANDLGRLWRALASTTEIEGGALRLTGAAKPGGEGITGHAELREFTVIKMPVFASILRLGTLDSLVGMIESKGLEFKLAEADLEWDGRRLSVAKGRAVGAGIALTGEGTFDLAGGTLDFAGTVGRVGRLQRMIGKVPLIGHARARARSRRSDRDAVPPHRRHHRSRDPSRALVDLHARVRARRVRRRPQELEPEGRAEGNRR